VKKMDIETSLKKVLATGKVTLGIKEAIKSKKRGETKLYIIANDCPNKNKLGDIAEDTPIYNFKGNSVDLGLTCEKPFPISIITVIDEGKSEILKQI
jgi:large subunit ribosomal protein L30e